MTAPPEPAVPPGAVTAGMVEAAQAYDLAHRSNYVSWTRPPDYQVARLLAGALPLIAEQAAAAGRGRMAPLVQAAQAVILNAGGTTPRHKRAHSGNCRDDCIPCGISALAAALDLIGGKAP